MFISTGSRIRWPFVAATMLGLSACGGGGNSNPITGPVLLKGAFMDVEGVEYNAPTRSGRTGPRGEFEYVAGETVTFSLGKLTLGSAKGAPLVTPFDFFSLTPSTGEAELRAAFGNRERVSNFDRAANITHFLATFDKDGNVDNGITITDPPDLSLDSLSFDAPLAVFPSDRFADFLRAHGVTTRIMTGLPLVHLYGLIGSPVPFHALVRSEQEFRGDDAAAKQATDFEYDAKGRWITARLDADGDGKAEEICQRTYTPAGLVQSASHEIDRDGDGTLEQTTIERSTYDSSGNRVELVTETRSGAGQPTSRSTETTTYSAAGFLLKDVRKNDNSGDGTDDYLATTDYVRDNKGNLLEWTESIDSNADGVPDSIRGTVNTLDARGRPIMSRHRGDEDADGTFESEVTIELRYNDAINERTAITEARRADGALSSRAMDVETFDEAGRELSFRNRRDDNADGVVDSIFSRERTYAINGLLGSKEINQDSNGDGTPEFRSIQTNTYDTSGKLMTRSDVQHTESFPNQMLHEVFTYGPDGALRTSLLTESNGGDGAKNRTWLTTHTYAEPSDGLRHMVEYYFGEGRFEE